MGCDTKGYIKGIELLPLCAIVQSVIRDNRGTKFHKTNNFELIDSYSGEITAAYTNFVYDEKAEYTQIRKVTLSEVAEHRKLWCHSYVSSENAVIQNSDEEMRWGIVSLGDWGHSREIIQEILNKCKEKGYEVYFHANDCVDDPVKM